MRHIHLKQCQSTQSWLKDNLSSFTSSADQMINLNTIIVTTDQQTEGYGRNQKNWQHFPGSLAMSFTLSANPCLTLSSLEIAILIANYFEKIQSQKIQLKWPNDLMINSKKCGGVIIDICQDHLIVGLGLNLKETENNLYGFIKIKKINIVDLALELVHFIEDNRILKNQDIIKRWNQKCLHLNQKVTIADNATQFQGIFSGINQNGFAIIDERIFASGSLFVHD